MITHVIYLVLLAITTASAVWFGHGKLKALRMARLFAQTCSEMHAAIEGSTLHAYRMTQTPAADRPATFEISTTDSERWWFHHELLAQLNNTTSGLMEAALTDIEVTVR